MDAGASRRAFLGTLLMGLSMGVGVTALALAYEQRRLRRRSDERRSDESKGSPAPDAIPQRSTSSAPARRVSMAAPEQAPPAPRVPPAAGIHWAQVASHNTIDSIWVVIRHQVYDVTQWLEEHPGGRFVLLAFAGRDATEAFETVGHPAIADREMEGMLVGHLVADPSHHGRTSSEAATAEKKSKEHRKARLTGGRPSVSLLPPTPTSALGPDSEVEALVERPLWKVVDKGFLPKHDPVGMQALVGTPFEVFCDMVDLLPSVTCDPSLRKLLEGDPERQERMRSCGRPEALADMGEDQLERAFAVLGYIMLAYTRSSCHGWGGGLGKTPHAKGGQDLPVMCAAVAAGEEPVLPEFLAAPLQALAQKLGRQPMVDYAASVLYNWERIDKDGPVVASNLRCVLRLTGLPDEEWFFKTHVIIESESGHAVSAVNDALEACSQLDDNKLLEHLILLEEALWRVVRACLPIMYERTEDGTPRCSEFVFYHILRPLIRSGKLKLEQMGADGIKKVNEQSVNGPSGAMSSLMPCCDAALGIRMSSDKLRQAIANFEKSMPVSHQEFLTGVRAQTSIRDYLKQARPVGFDEQKSAHHESLVRAFNRCISRVLDFRWQHWQYVRHFIMKPGNLSHAVGTGGTQFDFLQMHITDTEAARLQEENFGMTDGFNTPGVLDMSVLRPQLYTMPPVEPDSFWSVDGPNGLISAEPMWGLQDMEKWKSALPSRLHDAVHELLQLAVRMPSLCSSGGPFVGEVEAAKGKLVALSTLSEAELLLLPEAVKERLKGVLSHVAAGITSQGGREIPKCIKRPLQVISRSVGRLPRLEFCELVLSNWMNETIPKGIETVDDEEPTPKKRCVWRFLATPEEDWYRELHVVLHLEARDFIKAVRLGQAASRCQDDKSVVHSMEQVTHWLDKFSNYFDAHFENKDSRMESVTCSRLHMFVAQSMSSLENSVWVYCSGSSVLFPALHAFYGVRMELPDNPAGKTEPETEKTEVEKLNSYMRTWSKQTRDLMPKLHFRFLREELEKPGMSMRQYCLKRFGAQSISVEVLHDLEVAYNDGLNALVRFLSRRTHFVSRFFPQFASSYSQLHQEMEVRMRLNRLQLLKMRQRVDRCFEATTVRASDS